MKFIKDRTDAETAVTMPSNRKKYRRRSLLLIVLSVCLCVAVVPKGTLMLPVSAATTIEQDKAAIQKLEDELAVIRAGRSSAASAYEEAYTAYQNAQLDVQKAQAAKEALDKEIASLETEKEKTQELLTFYEQEIARYTEEISEKEAKIEELYDNFLERIRINYEDSFTSYLEILLASESFADLLYHIDIVASLLDYDERVLNSLDTSKRELQQLLLDNQELQEKALETYQDLAAQIPVLEEKRTANETLLQELEAAMEAAINDKNKAAEEKAAIEASYTQKQKELAAFEAALEEKIAAAQKETQKTYVGGVFGWPVPISYSTISSYYGYRTNPLYGGSELHNGIDIPCAYGTDIYAANDGTVITAAYHYSYGNYIVIDHGGGISTLYAHNSSLLVSVGQEVSKGDKIALAGSTGDSSGNHCHFSVRENGVAVNPLNYVVQP